MPGGARLEGLLPTWIRRGPLVGPSSGERELDDGYWRQLVVSASRLEREPRRLEEFLSEVDLLVSDGDYGYSLHFNVGPGRELAELIRRGGHHPLLLRVDAEGEEGALGELGREGYTLRVGRVASGGQVMIWVLRELGREELVQQSKETAQFIWGNREELPGWEREALMALVLPEDRGTRLRALGLGLLEALGERENALMEDFLSRARELPGFEDWWRLPGERFDQGESSWEVVERILRAVPEGKRLGMEGLVPTLGLGAPSGWEVLCLEFKQVGRDSRSHTYGYMSLDTRSMELDTGPLVPGDLTRELARIWEDVLMRHRPGLARARRSGLI